MDGQLVEEKNSHITLTIPKTTDDVFEIDRLKAEANDIASELVGKIRALGSRLIPVLLRIKEQLPHGEWTQWYEEFREKYSFKSLRQVQRDFKQLTAGDDQSESEVAEEVDEETPNAPGEPGELLREHVKQVKATLSDPSIKSDDERIARALELTENLELALNDGLLNASVDDPIRCVCRDRGNLDEDDYVPILLATLADQLEGIADELACAHCLDKFAGQILEIAERIKDREELDKRVMAVVERAGKRPRGVSARWTVMSVRRDRRFQEDMRLIKAAGGITYRGKKIYGTDEFFIERFTRKEIMAELENDLENQLGVGSITDYC